MKKSPKIEKWSDRSRRIVVRDQKGRFVTFEKLKRGMTLRSEADRIKSKIRFVEAEVSKQTKKNDTIYVESVLSKYTKTKVISRYKENSKKARSPQRKDAQYTMRALDKKGNVILTVTSYKLNSPLSVHGNTKQDAIEWTENKFYSELGYRDNGNYDQSYGQVIEKAKGIKVQRGWSYFDKKAVAN